MLEDCSQSKKLQIFKNCNRRDLDKQCSSQAMYKHVACGKTGEMLSIFKLIIYLTLHKRYQIILIKIQKLLSKIAVKIKV